MPVASGSERRTASTEVPSRTVTPRSRSPASTASPAKGSVRLSSWWPRTTRVTDDPSAAIQVAASQATTPPPTTTRRSGTSTTPVASRESHGSASAYASGTCAALPVAITTARRARTTTSPSADETRTVRSPVIRASPRSTARPAPFAQSAWPESS